MIPVHGTRISHLMHRDLNVMEAEPGPCAGLDGRAAGLDGRAAGLDGRAAGLDGRAAGLNGPSAALDSVPGHAYP
jgi:hypothetical protein